MSDIEELPSWAPKGEQPDQPATVAAAGGKRGRGLLYGLLALLLLGGAVAGGYFLFGGSGDETATTEGDDVESAATSVEDEAGAASDENGAGDATASDGVEGGDDEAAATDNEAEADETEAAPEDLGPPVDISDGSVRWTRIENNTLYLEGTAPTQEMKDLIEQVTVEVAGDAEVVNDLVVDPTSPANTVGYPVYINDVVLFDFNSSEVRPSYYPLLDMGAKLLVFNETYTIKVVAHADSVGSEEANLKISQQRAQAVKDYYVSQGAPPERVLTEAKGEEGASDSETDDEAAANRRVEFFIGDIEDQPAG